MRKVYLIKHKTEEKFLGKKHWRSAFMTSLDKARVFTNVAAAKNAINHAYFQDQEGKRIFWSDYEIIEASLAPTGIRHDIDKR